jgi:peroxiredoxin
MKLFFLSSLLILCTQFAGAQPAIGELAPDISLNDINGNTIKLSDLRGKIVLVDFWASWCMPCRRSNRELRPVYDKYKNKGFEIYGISLDENPADWKKAMQSDRIKWKQVIEKGGWDASTALAWKIEALPSSFLLDKQGRVLAVNPSRLQIEKYLKTAAR